ncbi:MAG TPA: YHYH protein, partial [Candidatus Poseidoniales archaeon]
DDGSCEYDSEPEPAPGCTDPSASNYDEAAEEDDGSCEYDIEPVDNGTGSQSWWEGILLCDSTEQVEPVDDYNTTDSDNHLCQLSFEIGETEIVIDSNGIPNHDLESGPGCCTSEQTLEWRIPLVPNNQTGCDPSLSSDGCTMAPERDAVAFAVNGVPIFGPEDGPGGDAVAGHEGEYEEDRQHIWLGICHGHSGPGGAYHYHADANCAHWHPDEETNQTWRDYHIDSSRSLSEHSPIVGFALDGYPIYGFVGWDEEGVVSEMKSSYRLKEGETGYNGIDDYEYVVGLGDLDSCNGQFGPTPDYPEGIYHYHTTWENGEGGIGFPYFINCYRGEVSLDSQNGEGDDEVDCSGRGETWGPGIGPPPEGCEGGPPGQSSDISSAFGIVYRLVPPSGGMLAMMIIAVAFVRVLAFAPVSPSRAGITALYHQVRV